MRISFSFKIGSETRSKFLRVFFLCKDRKYLSDKSGGTIFGRKKGKSIIAMVWLRNRMPGNKLRGIARSPGNGCNAELWEVSGLAFSLNCIQAFL